MGEGRAGMFLMRRDGGRRGSIDRLARYIDAVIQDEARDRPPLDPLDAEIVEDLHESLLPVEPDERFVWSLRLRLIAAADQRGPGEIFTWRQPRFLIGAASIVSAAAVIAYVARSRSQARPAA